ncbi:DUF3304 domain-containing protein [Pseudomonas fulva]|uniref:DUF3304 domain-containing protein n=1 Tax=Pseudomonas fulva TaxID=47880 RepID=UPI00201D7CE1|nr:DUF3304 domain-containing protein [Pseudomonas fulva]UQY36641.1 DUF3304 domain-containing protein [Pseudomonas fulva]
MKQVNELFKRWKSLPAVAKSLFKFALLGLLVIVYVAWSYAQMPGAILYVHNHTDRPIFSYAVNEAWGGNASAYGGGGASCCSRIEGDVLTVEWVKSITQPQYEAGMREETHTLAVPNPPRTRQDKYLHVHFFPGDQVRLFWSPNLDSPFEDLKEAPDSKEQTP